MIPQALASLIIAYAVFKVFTRTSRHQAGTNWRPGIAYFLKYCVAYVAITIRKWIGGKKATTGVVPGLGTAPESLNDQPRPLPANGNALDSSYFCAFDSKGDWLIARIGRRHDGEAELWLTLNVEGDGVYESPIHPDTLVLNAQNEEFCAENLSFEPLEDFRRWRISFNGPLRKGLRSEAQCSQTSNDKLSHVKFTFIWEALTDLYCSDSDISTHLLASGLAREVWCREYFSRLKDLHQTRYEQAGGMTGSVIIDGGDPKRLQFRGIRDRTFGVREWVSFKRYISHLITLEDGSFIVLSVVDFPLCFQRIVSGCVFMPNSERCIIERTDLCLEEVGEEGEMPRKYSFTFTAGGTEYKMRVFSRHCLVYYHGEKWESKCLENIVDVVCNSNRGHGVAEFFYRNENGCPFERGLPRTLVREVPAEDPNAGSAAIVYFDQEICTHPSIVGGKASQLGFLTQIQKQEGFVVPYGICLTTKAFTALLRDNELLQKKIADLEAAASRHSEDDLRKACTDVMTQIAESVLGKDMRLQLAEAMIKAFKQDVGHKLFAVRSSAVGEDGSEISSAGQMETLLGVRGDPLSVESAVLHCWASQYAFQAVEYKRQHGQIISSGMGVIVQEMVPSESSGVLFTRDAITGDPSMMSINANYGLGESVVSGLSEPDTIRVKRQATGNLKILEKRIGSKAVQIKAKGGGGTETVNVGGVADLCCLTDEHIWKLCSIGIRLERIMGGARDVEWAVYKNDVYILQARPVTTYNQADEHELLHEFDSPHSKEDEFCTSANIGEMMPGAMSPLTMSTVLRAIDFSLQELQSISGHTMTKHASIFIKISCGHAFINLHALEAANENRNLITDRRMLELSLIGQAVQCMTDEEVNSYNRPLSFPQRFVNAVRFIRNLWGAEEPLKLWEERLKSYSVSQSTSAGEIFADIDARLPDLYEVWWRGILCSSLSGMSAMVLINVLTKGNKRYTQEHYSDVAQLLAVCDHVVSASVPVMIKEIADQIRRQGDVVHFTEISAKDAALWLQSDKSGDAGKRFKGFLELHGHRCVREADLLERSWAQDSSQLVSTIQAIASQKVPEGSKKNEQLKMDVLLGKLKTPLSFIGKQVIRRALPKAWRSVALREWGKSLQVKMNDKFKQAYWRLASAMKLEGRLPDEELLFFLTHSEIRRLIITRSAKIISRAQKRRKLYPRMAKLTFHRDNIGHPAPILSRPADAHVLLQLTGMPVSLGTVRGFARVVMDLESAGTIQAGEVLVVPFTDVGWSPYFPLISGLVTDIGGLVSHGAVVAREYGIPCVVNCAGATEAFSTGDFVELCGDRGVIRKLRADKPQNSDTT